MFKSDEQVKAFVDLLEKFMIAAINCHQSADVEDAVWLNKSRTNLELFVKLACGITPMSDTTDELLCPECGGVMALRTNRTNGNKFWGCRKYPECRGTRDEDGLSKEERAAKREVVVPQEGGYSFNKPKRDPVTEVAPPPPPVKTEWINPFAKK